MISIIEDRFALEKFFKVNPGLYFYQIGDLDDFYRDRTTWYGLTQDNELCSVILLYKAQDLPVLLALSPEKEREYLEELLSESKQFLPERFYSHLSPGIEKVFGEGYTLTIHGNFCKMLLKHTQKLEAFHGSSASRLSVDDLQEIQKFYEDSYPGNSFDPRMLETGMYFGIRKNTVLVSIAGVHVYSKKFRIAALGNIASSPEHRGKGYGTSVTARLCRELLKNVDTIGLNVSTRNISAIRSYEKLGFDITARYNEITVVKK